jgi:hypothetical protein
MTDNPQVTAAQSQRDSSCDVDPKVLEAPFFSVNGLGVDLPEEDKANRPLLDGDSCCGHVLGNLVPREVRVQLPGGTSKA